MLTWLSTVIIIYLIRKLLILVSKELAKSSVVVFDEAHNIGEFFNTILQLLFTAYAIYTRKTHNL